MGPLDLRFNPRNCNERLWLRYEPPLDQVSNKSGECAPGKLLNLKNNVEIDGVAMNRILLRFVAAIAVMGLASPALQAQGGTPYLVRAVLHTHTDGDDRDHDTGIFVEVTEADGHTVLAQIGNAEACCGRYGYADNEDHDLNIPLQKPGIPKSDCINFKFRMGIMAKGGIFGNTTFTGRIDNWPIVSLSGGNDTWKFNAWLRLYFSDGSMLESNKLNQTLSSTGGKLVWDNLQ